MSLLVDLMQHAEDPAYAEAAAPRRAQAPSPRPPQQRRRVAGGALVVALVGVLIGVAAATLRTAGDDSTQRAALVREVQRRTAESDALAARSEALRAEVSARRDAALAAQGGGQAAALAQLELAAASGAVAGPGIEVLLDDRPAGDATTPGLPRGGQVGSGRVLDRDLQQAVNGLWAAGAEAVSVNDLRLTARTAIRSAGEAVLVDYRPLSPPYVVRAIGDPGRLEAAFVDGAAGRRLAAYTSLYGLRFAVSARDQLRLPAGTVPDPRSASALPASSGPASPGPASPGPASPGPPGPGPS
jgi:uncharacterized protein YlxW (UPF0749 family)